MERLKSGALTGVSVAPAAPLKWNQCCSFAAWYAHALWAHAP